MPTQLWSQQPPQDVVGDVQSTQQQVPPSW
jgi:hypothetical protein